MSEGITKELRDHICDINWTEIIDHMHEANVLDGEWLDTWHSVASNLCDAIDAVHANLERENDELRTHHRLSGEITGDDLLRMFAWLYSHALAGDAS